MRLKVVVAGYDSPVDYKLLKTTIATVGSLRERSILRFIDQRLIVISSPKSYAINRGNNILTADAGQMWCSIPKDAFQLYSVESAREQNCITMEYNCSSLLSAFKRYDKAMSQGSVSDMTIKLEAMPQWNKTSANDQNSGNSSGGRQFIHALKVTFEETVHINGAVSEIVNNTVNTNNKNGSKGDYTTNFVMSGSNKVIRHSFQVPICLLHKGQDAKLQEPVINNSKLVMYKLPSISEEFGNAFYSFIKRIERYSSVTNVRLRGKHKKESTDENKNAEFNLLITEDDWNVNLSWNGPLEIIDDSKEDEEDENNRDTVNSISDTIRSTNQVIENSMQIENSMTIENTIDQDVSLERNNGYIRTNNALGDVMTMVEKAEQENSSIHEVIIKVKDWKVCGKLYSVFEDVILSISHDESCIFYCSLDRDGYDDYEAEAEEGYEGKERGQIIYYMARSRPL
ncbi:hypothetical protein Kpol_543p24 [Vanderwaltozyma polyspora DSM 70294]|uniref:Checkpoint protein n=1 Tax=Vanderwaltozyma polyspora (strain ATCC 22028 / DSM 70294 / BCRC 21397 / CBS 2163 / NBRC 10782 / NRRL Y-8283 / UCD 57-17) TaxID=436907 RepID=A7THM9_VANPO|nr:uncharacterized protein Kpol_543p24 [Vanderwaltozyma polyspora DSM 70294]EDO18195.1 hypothetical protein Kpol_543p24 [Vanderwaltozyma polyspora DSM 70294]